ncbi:Hypothetical protein SMAX5B_012880 [Scophthalmus maximus]|uniref:Uncharacterized protein n=1 Tax=Scophthalmus maximus TaxID=52904 RepID=A0A2U9BAB4_SCOMX|nr:Hypothetical protein SMAX5B_012880 [Scophthalmus maximus]
MFMVVERMETWRRMRGDVSPSGDAGFIPGAIGGSTLENTEDRLNLESQKKTTSRLEINLTLETLDMSRDQCESVAVSVDSLLSDAKRMQLQCRERSEQLSMAAVQLREESASLREQCEATQLDMAHIRRQLDELLDTKAAIEARERQARKLSKQL